MTVGDKVSIRSDSLSLRILSAALMVPAGLGVVFFGGHALVIACLLCGAGMWSEYWSVTVKSPRTNLVWASGLITVSACCLTLGFLPGWFAIALLSGFTFSALFALLLTPKKAFWLIIGLLFIAAATSALIFIRDMTVRGLIISIAIMVCVWATDIAAYFAGKGFGGPQLSPMGSPNKTWSGAAGAVICAALIGVLIAGVLQANLLAWLCFSAVLSIVSQGGDLLESFWKRHFGVKDSGSLIPGHGGLLDRLDSFSFVLVCVGLVLVFQPDFPVTFLGLERS